MPLFHSRQSKWCFSLLTPLYSLLAFGRSGLFGPPLCGGSAPATPPLPTTCLADLVSLFEQVPSRKSFAKPRPASPRANLAQTKPRHSLLTPLHSLLASVPALAPSPTAGRHRTARPGACPASRPKTAYISSHRRHGFPARLSPSQIWDAPAVRACWTDMTKPCIITAEYEQKFGKRGISLIQLHRSLATTGLPTGLHFKCEFRTMPGRPRPPAPGKPSGRVKCPNPLVQCGKLDPRTSLVSDLRSRICLNSR